MTDHDPRDTQLGRVEIFALGAIAGFLLALLLLL